MRFNRYFHNLKTILSDRERKSIGRMLYENMLLLLKDKSLPVHYYSRGLYRKDQKDLYAYVNNKTLYSLWPLFNSEEYIPILDNKLLFHLFFKDKHIPLPKLLAYNINALFIHNNKVQHIPDPASFMDFLDLLLKEAAGPVFIKQSTGSHGGKGIFRINPEDPGVNKHLMTEIHQNLIRSSFIFEAALDQHPVLDVINPSCINTIRTDTFIDKDLRIENMAAYIRFGRGNIPVDNISSGGCAVDLDLTKGTLQKYGNTSLTVSGGETYTSHPLTGVAFEGTAIPFVQETKSLVRRAAGFLPSLRLVGWDVALTPGGPVLVEGNHDYDITGLDRTSGGYNRNPVFIKVLEEYKGLKRNKTKSNSEKISFGKNCRKFFRVVLNEKNRKPLLTIIRECFRLLWLNKSFPMHYFGRYLYIKGKSNIEDYVPNKILYSLWPRFNATEMLPILDNKLLFEYYFGDSHLTTIQILLYNINHFFFVGTETHIITDEQQFEHFLEQIINKLKNKSIFIKKTTNSFGGKNIFKINSGDLPMEGNKRHAIFSEIVSSSYIFQETIVQHSKLDQINPSCINSIRIDTFLRKEGKAEVISAFLRFGVLNTLVDNTSSGGSQISIDLESGRLDKYGYATITDGKGRIYEAHPDTEFVFEGFTVPFFAESIDLVRKAAECIPGIRLIGWDVGITENGPVLIEGNHDYDMTGTDLALYGCRKNPVLQLIFQEAGIRIP